MTYKFKVQIFLGLTTQILYQKKIIKNKKPPSKLLSIQLFFKKRFILF